jgi:glycolate oxidase iron-sulfur subunit
LCLPYCPTFRLTGDEAASPRGRLTAMAAAADGLVSVDVRFEEVMGFCLQCRACEAVCPSLAPFGRAMEGARAEVAAQHPRPTRRVRHFALGRRVLGSRPVMRLVSIGAAALQRAGLDRGLRRLPLRPSSTVGRTWSAIGDERAGAAVLAGCVMDPWFGDVRTATVALLRRAGYRVEVPAGQTCCGALAAHDGAAAEAHVMASQNAVAFAGYDLVVADAAGCSAHLKNSLDAAADVTEVVAAAIADGRLPTLDANGRSVAIQDPCHLRHAQRITDEPRAILGAAGYEIRETDPAGLCCGAAGIYSLLHADTSAELGRRKADQVRGTRATVVASANPGCEMQLRVHLGAGIRVAHPIELYAEAIGAI